MRNIKRIIQGLLSLALLCTLGWSQSDEKVAENKCCQRAFESGVDSLHGIPEKHCRGTRWSTAVAGSCFKQEKAKCYHHLGTTVVTVHEYELKWNAEGKKCDTKSTGNTHNIEVADCGFDECED